MCDSHVLCLIKEWMLEKVR